MHQNAPGKSVLFALLSVHEEQTDEGQWEKKPHVVLSHFFLKLFMILSVTASPTGDCIYNLIFGRILGLLDAL